MSMSRERNQGNGNIHWPTSQKTS